MQVFSSTTFADFPQQQACMKSSGNFKLVKKENATNYIS